MGSAPEIQVNDRPYQLKGPPDQTIQSLANEVCSTLSEDDPQMVVGLKCDGGEIEGEQLADVLQTSANRFQRVELQTVSVSEQVRATLAQAMEIFDQTAGLRHEAADHLAAGEYDPAMDKLQRLIEVWKQVQQTTIMSCQALGVDVETLIIAGHSFTDVLESIRSRLNDLKNGMENQDFVLVSDILRYEFDEPIGHWMETLQHLYELTENKTGD